MFVFSVGILVIIPTAFGLADLRRAQSKISRDAPLYSASFICANQAAIATSLWCRVLEAAKKLQQDMGYASYGLRSFSLSMYGVGSKNRTGHTGASKQSRAQYASGSKQSRSHYASGTRRSLSEDEIELRADDRVRHTATVESSSAKGQGGLGGIGVRRDFGYVEHEITMDT